MNAERCFALGAALVLCASVATAQEVVAANYQGLEEAQGIKSIVLSGQRRYGLPDEVHERLRSVLAALKPGDPIEVTLDANGRVSALRKVDAGNAGARQQIINGRWEKHEVVNGRRWAVLTDRRLPIPEDVYQLHKRVFEFTRRSTPVQILTDGGQVRDIAVITQQEGQARIDPAILERVVASERNDLVTVNGDQGRFLTANLTELRIQPVVPNTTPPQYVPGGEVTYKLDTVRSFVNERLQAAPGPGAPGGPANDVFATEDVQVGDIVGIGFKTGQVVALTDQTYTLRVWRNDEWGAEDAPASRAAATAVKFVSLTSQQTQPLGQGELLLKVGRSREHGRELVIDVELAHTAPESLLTKAKLKVHVGAEPMGLEATPTATEVVDLPTLFENTPFKLRHVVQTQGALDGRIEVALEADSLLPLSSPAARHSLLVALEVATTANDLDAMARAYLACGKNGDVAVAQLLATRAVQPPVPPALAERHREAVVAGLSAFADRKAARAIVEELKTPDRSLFTTHLERSAEIKRVQMDSDDRPMLYKRRLLDLLGEIEGGLAPPHGTDVFDLSWSAPELAESIESSFLERPADAVATLLDVAASVTPASDNDEQERAGRAAKLLQRLGAPILPALLQELRRREIEVDTIEKARSAGASAADLVHQAIELLVADASKKRRIELDQQVEEARGLVAQRAWGEALPRLRKVLEQNREHAGAVELMPQVLQALAEQARPTDRAGAARFYEESLPYLQLADQGRVKATLGEMALAALLEELEEVAIRSTNHDLGAKVRAATQNEAFAGRDLEDGWVEVTLGAETKGYIRRKCMKTEEGSETFTVQDAATPYDTVDELIKRAREQAPTLNVQCDEALGHLCAREGAARVALEDYKGALLHFDRAKELAPTDPRLALEWGAWLKARQQLLGAVAAILALVVGFVLMQMFARPKRVKFEGEFKHYGADRARRERDLDVDGEKTGGEEGAPPADAPPAGAP